VINYIDVGISHVKIMIVSSSDGSVKPRERELLSIDRRP